MSELNETQVIIAGRVLTLTGYETAEYTQRVGNYINKKLDECKTDPGFKNQNKETQMLMLAINVTDDYMKIVEKLEENEQIIKEKDKEIYNLKHDIITTQQRLDKADEQVRILQDRIAESSKKLLQLDAKINNRGRKKTADPEDSKKTEEPSKAKLPETSTVSGPVKSSEPAKAPESVKSPEPAKAPETLKSYEQMKFSDEPLKPSDSGKPAEGAKAADAVKVPESVKSHAAVKASEPVKVPDSPKNIDESKTVDSPGTSDDVKAPEPAKDTGPVGSASGSIGFRPDTKPRLVKDE